MIVIGNDGDKHNVLQFEIPSNEDDPKERAPRKQNQKPGNCTIQLNQNSFLLKPEMIFVILNTQKGDCSAKPLSAAKIQDEKMPSVELLKADVGFAKDCWKTKDNQRIQTIAKSSTDEYLNCSSIDISNFDPTDDSSLKKLKTIQCKLKGQEIQM